MIIRMPRLAVPAAALTVLLGTVGCGSQQQEAAQDDRLAVVTSTDVWADVVRAVAGNAVEIKTIMDDPAADPHSYEASPSDAADVARADLVVFNGGGYDEFMNQFLGQAGDKPTVEAVTLAKDDEHGTHSHEGSANEHVWYDLPVATAVAQRVAEELGTLEPTQAEQFTAAATTFGDGVDELNSRVVRIAERHAGAKAVLTEPVARYLVDAAKLEDATPPEFVEAVEEETDPPAAAAAATTKLLTDRQVQVLIYNPQTETPVTGKVRAAAQHAGIPVVTMTETLPENTTYLDWMSGQIDALNTALG